MLFIHNQFKSILQQLLHSLGEISDLTELILTANMPLAEMKRLNWTTTENESSHWNTIGKFLSYINTFYNFSFDLLEQTSLQDTKITLNPMQIRTFQVTVQ